MWLHEIMWLLYLCECCRGPSMVRPKSNRHIIAGHSFLNTPITVHKFRYIGPEPRGLFSVGVKQLYFLMASDNCASKLSTGSWIVVAGFRITNHDSDQSYNSFACRWGWKVMQKGCGKKRWKTWGWDQNDVFFVMQLGHCKPIWAVLLEHVVHDCS